MDIHLDGAEITIIKSLGLGGSTLSGEQLRERVGNMEVAEMIDVLKSLIDMGYIDCDKNSFYSKEELDRAEFRVNSGYAKDLKEALDPRPEPKKSRRVRRE